MAKTSPPIGIMPDHNPTMDMQDLMDAHKMDHGMHETQKRAAEIKADKKRHGGAKAEAAKRLEAYRAISSEPKK